MSRFKKLYEKIKNNPVDVSFEEIHQLLTKYGGFIHRNKASSHNIYTHPNLHGINDMVNIPYNRPIKKVYILKAIEKFELANPDLID